MGRKPGPWEAMVSIRVLRVPLAQLIDGSAVIAGAHLEE